jgi:hypothetical protein
VRKIINQKLIEGELSQSPLTLMDLETTRRIFVQSLQGAHHPRIVYPEAKTPQPPALSASETQTPPIAEPKIDESQQPQPAPVS